MSPLLVEQAQLVAELIETGEITIKTKSSKTIESSIRHDETQGIKRTLSEATSFSSESDEHHHQHKNKKIKTGLLSF